MFYRQMPLFIILISISTNLYSQSGSFHRIYSLPPFNIHSGKMLNTLDGGFIIAGYDQYMLSGTNVYPSIRKFDSLGNMEWVSQLNNNSYGRADGIIQLQDSSYYIVCSNNRLNFGLMDFYVAHLSVSGQLLSWNNYSHSDLTGNDQRDVATGISLAADGNILIVGHTQAQGSPTPPNTAILQKIDLNGNLMWCTQTNTQMWGTGFFSEMSVSGNGDILACGAVGSFPNQDFLVAVFDPAGNNRFIHKKGTADSDVATDIKATPDGGIVIAGYSYANGDYNNMVMKLDSNGAEEWSAIFGTPLNDRLTSVLVMPDSSFIFSGFSAANGNTPAAAIYKMTALGNLEWSKAFNHINGEFLDIRCLWSPTDSSMYLSGKYFDLITNSYSLYVAHLQSNSNPTCYFQDFNVTSLATVLTTQTINVASNSCAQRTIAINMSLFPPQMNTSDLCISTSINNHELEKSILIFPNPASENLFIRKLPASEGLLIEIHTISGKKIISQSIAGQESELRVNLSMMADGIYFVVLNDRGKSDIRKLVIIRDKQ